MHRKGERTRTRSPPVTTKVVTMETGIAFPHSACHGRQDENTEVANGGTSVLAHQKPYRRSWTAGQVLLGHGKPTAQRPGRHLRRGHSPHRPTAQDPRRALELIGIMP